MATHSSIIAWGILWMEEPSGLPSMVSHRVGHNWSNLAAAAIINKCWILSKAFSASIEIIVWLLSFNLIRCIKLIDLSILKNPCIPGINPTWSECMSFLMCWWILFAKFCWGFLHLCSSVISGCSFIFVCVVFAWFWYLGDGGLVEWVWKCSFLCNFLKEF